MWRCIRTISNHVDLIAADTDMRGCYRGERSRPGLAVAALFLAIASSRR